MSDQKQIPMNALQDAECSNDLCCGKVFHMVYHVKYYPGGVWSAVPVCIPIPVFICRDCREEWQVPKGANLRTV